MNKKKISDYYLERYALGELPKEESQKILHLASTDPEIKSALKKIESSNHDILSLYPASKIKDDLLSLLEKDSFKSKVSRWLDMSSFPSKRSVAISSVCTVLLLVLIFIVLPRSNRRAGIELFDIGQDFSLVKGISDIDMTKTQLLVFRKTNEEVEILENGTRAGQGDLLQLAYIAVTEPYGIILSIDGRGYVTLHYPEESSGSTELKINKKSLLPHAIELDDAPHFERFIFITSKNKIDVDDVLRIAGDLAKNPEKVKTAELDLPKGIDQHSVLILKGED